MNLVAYFAVRRYAIMLTYLFPSFAEISFMMLEKLYLNEAMDLTHLFFEVMVRGLLGL